MEIQELKKIDLETEILINKFLIQLTGQNQKISRKHLEEIISDPNSHLFFAVNSECKYTGMITVGFYISPTGKKSWVEDVVVDDEYRRLGIGKTMMEFAIQFTKQKQATTLMLTSNPKRISANKLYQNLGFQTKETNVYLMQLEEVK